MVSNVVDPLPGSVTLNVNAREPASKLNPIVPDAESKVVYVCELPGMSR